MKKISILVITLFTFLKLSLADEGMWLPIFLEQLNETEMKSMGMKISAKDIYDINNGSLKDAIVLFGRGCTGEIISEQGLLLTNHHCGYGSIQNLSSVENDYLTHGFWAMKQQEELPCPGLTVSLLIRMEDVSAKILKDINPQLTEAQRAVIISKNANDIIEELKKNSSNNFVIRPFYNGNEFYLFEYEVYKDIRLVGAPPSAIGKFGGDTDNWVWPRHTGDFSLFRIYVDKDNKPTAFSKDNKPYFPKKSLTISAKGVQKNDFTFVFGYPGRTQEYLPSSAVSMILNHQNPANIAIREKILEIMDGEMKKNDKVRIQYSAKYAGIANYWKKWLGESKGLERYNAIERKIEFEKQFLLWANQQKGNSGYINLLSDFEKIYKTYTPVNVAVEVYGEALMGIELLELVDQFQKLVSLSLADSINNKELEKTLTQIKNYAAQHFKNYDTETDKKLFAAIIPMFRSNIPTEINQTIFSEYDKKFKNNYKLWADELFKKTMFIDENKVNNLLNNYKPTMAKQIAKDPAYILVEKASTTFDKEVFPTYRKHRIAIDSLNRIYIKAQQISELKKRFYPDANSTLRIAYGKVDDYEPIDGVHYLHYTTIDGIMEKGTQEIEDYQVPAKLKALYEKKDYGRWTVNGTVPVAFTASNHTTGGNSGSPVFNAEGQLIGTNFDRNWEGTMSDIMYDPSMCRNIVLDIRYALFIIEKYAGCNRLIDEMKIVFE